MNRPSWLVPLMKFVCILVGFISLAMQAAMYVQIGPLMKGAFASGFDLRQLHASTNASVALEALERLSYSAVPFSVSDINDIKAYYQANRNQSRVFPDASFDNLDDELEASYVYIYNMFMANGIFNSTIICIVIASACVLVMSFHREIESVRKLAQDEGVHLQRESVREVHVSVTQPVRVLAPREESTSVSELALDGVNRPARASRRASLIQVAIRTTPEASVGASPPP